jgi:hypothetical protein
MSAGIYRYLGGEIHQPLMLIAIYSAVSALGVYFVYLIAEKLFNPKTAILATWFLMLYPEACLLGSSQMREALIPTLSLLIIYLILQIQEKFSWRKVLIVITVFLFSTSFSVPFSVLMLIVVAVMLTLPFYQKWIDGHNKWLAGFITALVFVVSMVVTWLFVGKAYGAWYQQYLSLYGSGKLTTVLEKVPEYLHSSIITIYGVFRPLLPAALTSSGNSVWQGIAIWRSLGWAVLLFLLLIASIKVIKEKKLLHLAGSLTFLNWIWIFLSSYRSGGDMWDNPRYRLFLVGVQILLAAWFISEYKAKEKNPWLRRGIVASVLTVGLYMLWYVDRNVFDFGWKYSDIWMQMTFNFQLIIVYLFVDVGASAFVKSRLLDKRKKE